MLGGPQGGTLYAGFPESLDSGVREADRDEPKGASERRRVDWPRPQFTEEQRGTSIDEDAQWRQLFVPEVNGMAVFAGRFSWISLINPDFRPRKHGQNVVAGSDTRALFP